MIRRLRLAFITAVSWFAIVPSAHAVAIYDALQFIDAFENNGFYANVGAGGVLKTGNSEFGSLAGSSYLGYRRSRHAILLSGLAEYTEAKGEKVADNSLEHARYRFYLTKSEAWALEAFGQHERDLFRRIRLRALGGGAVRYELPQMGPVETAIGTGAFVESIRTNKSDKEPDSGAEYEAVRNSTYLTVAIAPKGGGRFGLTGYYQPRVNKISDYRASAKVFVSAQAADMVKLEVFAALAYDRSPAGSVKTTDTTSGFKLSFELKPRKIAVPEPENAAVTAPAESLPSPAPAEPVVSVTPAEEAPDESAEMSPVLP